MTSVAVLLSHGSTVSGSIGPYQSYANTGGMGNRTGTITASTNCTLYGTATATDLIDGDNLNNGAAFNFYNAISQDGNWIKFDFGSRRLIDEAVWLQSGTSGAQGTWKWQGSNNNSSWTDIGSTFTLGGVKFQKHTTLNGNTTGYRYYRLLATRADTSYYPSESQVLFRIDGSTQPVTTTSYANAGGTGDRRASISMTYSGSQAGTLNSLIDGVQAAGWFWGSDGDMVFDFGAGVTKCVQEFKLYSGSGAASYSWCEGSNDNSTWEVIGGKFDAGAAPGVNDTMSINDKYFRYYKFAARGIWNFPYEYECEFKLA